MGDTICVEKYHGGTRFVKGYTVNFTDELFKIIQDIDTGEDIKGRFYERELSVVQ